MPVTLSELQHNLNHIRHTIAHAAQQFQRNLDEIQLLAVSKTRSVAELQLAMSSGLRQFGENYVQEALPKIQALASEALTWHFIGPLQSNKTRLLATHFDWVHSLDSLKHAQRLHEQRPTHLPPLNVCIQVNVSEEPQKSGIALAEVVSFAEAVIQLNRLRLRGLMAIPAYHDDFELQRHSFHLLQQAYQELRTCGFSVDTLSMGMTDDLVAAIAEGSTMVRIGTGIFGERESR